MRQLMTVMYFTVLVIASASALKLAKEEGSAVTTLGSESNQAGMDTALSYAPPDAITFEPGNDAKEFEKFDDKVEEYFVVKYLEAIKKLGEYLKKSLDNVGKHFEMPL